jgi:hypothetical protein
MESLAVAFGSAQLAVKVLGPTAEYVGGGLRSWTEHRVKNVRRIFDTAARRLGPELESEGRVPPKVLGLVLDAGSYADDELAAEYFGGVLASSRSGVARDDRGASIMSLVSRLSVYQVRTHYTFYFAARALLVGRDIKLGNLSDLKREGQILVPFSSYGPAMSFDGTEDQQGILRHCFDGLVREGLIDFEWASGSPDHVTTFTRKAFAEPSAVFSISVPGIELYMWAHGAGSQAPWGFIETTWDPGPPLVEVPDGYARVIDLPVPTPDEPQPESLS